MRSILGWSVLAMFLVGCGSPPTTHPNTTPYPVTRVQPGTSGSSASPTPRTAAANPGTAAPAPQPAPTPTFDRPAISLDQERQAQAIRAASDLTKKTGVTVEKAETAGPKWWPAGGAVGNGYGRGRGTSLDLAYQQASKQAAGADHAAAVTRAAYTRLSTGDYLAWVELKGAVAAAPTPPHAPAPPPVVAPTPTPAPAAPAPTAAASDVPSWFSTTAKEEDGRVIVGAMADAPSVREAPTMASEAGKSALAQLTGAEPTEFRLESTYVKKQGNGFRAYVLVSSKGTIKK